MAFVQVFSNQHWTLNIGAWVPDGTAPNRIEMRYEYPSQCMRITQVAGSFLPDSATIRIYYEGAMSGDGFSFKRGVLSGQYLSWLTVATGYLNNPEGAPGMVEYTFTDLTSRTYDGLVQLRFAVDSGCNVTNITIQDNNPPPEPPKKSALASTVMLSVDGALCSPCGLGGSGAWSAVQQIGAHEKAGLASVGNVGGGGTPAALSAPVRIAGGGSGIAASGVSLDGGHFTAALSQAMPLSAMAGVASLAAPLALANPAVLFAPYSVAILIDGRDVTKQVSECTIVSSEEAIFDTVSLTLPDGEAWPLDSPPSEIIVSLSDAVHVFMVEEFGGDGPARTIWGRPLSALYAAPWSSTGVWNERSSGAALASQLAADIAGASWEAVDFPTPPRWEVDGTPADAIVMLAAAAGGVAVARSDSPGITIRRRWPVRPIDMTSSAVIITRETALDLSIGEDSTPTYGSVIVHGYSPDALLPKFATEGSPTIGQPAYLRLYWQGDDHPPVASWITDGSAQLVGTVSEDVTETIVFNDGSASVAWPIWDFLEFEWLGTDCGDITWLDGGFSTDLELASPGYGVAVVTYRTKYERWLLSGQAVDTVLFGVDVSQGAFSADVRLASGGLAAGELKEALLGSVPACVNYGEAFLDDSRVRHTVKATLPRTGHHVTGQTAWVEDELTGLTGFGKIAVIETKITPSRITQNFEVALC